MSKAYLSQQPPPAWSPFKKGCVLVSIGHSPQPSVGTEQIAQTESSDQANQSVEEAKETLVSDTAIPSESAPTTTRRQRPASAIPFSQQPPPDWNPFKKGLKFLSIGRSKPSNQDTGKKV